MLDNSTVSKHGLSWSLAFCATGCWGPNAQLADLPSLNVVVRASSWYEPGNGEITPSGLYVHLSYDEEQFRKDHGGDCATIGDIDGAINTTPLVLESDGGEHYEGGCLSPSFGAELEIGVGRDTTLQLADESARVVATYSGSEFSPRIAWPVTPPEWTFSAGQTVQLEWSHPEDLVETLDVWFAQQLAGVSVTAENVTATATGVQFQVPATLPYTGPARLNVMFGRALNGIAGDAETCSGAAACGWSLARAYAHPATLVQ